MDDAFRHCQELVREADKDRFLATLFAPERYRGPLYALHAFNAEIARVRDRINSPLPGEVRLQWWRDALTDTARGDVAANPVAAALLDTVRRFALPIPVLLDLIDARTFDLYDEPMASIDELERYALATSSALIGLAARILADGASPGLDEQVQHAGIADAIAGVLKSFGLHSSRGQLYLPDDMLAERGALAADILAGRATKELRAALGDLGRTARRHLAELNAGLGRVPPALLPAFLPIALVGAVLDRMEAADYDPFQPLVVPQWRRQWILWRAAQRPAKFIEA